MKCRSLQVGMGLLSLLACSLPVTAQITMPPRVAATAMDFKEIVAYYPQKRPGYTAWVKLFLFGNGDLGLSFKEIRKSPNPRFMPPSIEFIDATSLPYQYSRTYFAAGHPNLLTEGVYMKSMDGGQTWQQTGRAWGGVGYMAGYPDGRMVRALYKQNSSPETGEDRHYTSVRESTDGGNTWKQIARLLDGFSYPAFRVKKLRDGSLMTIGPITPTFGPGGARVKMSSSMPGERLAAQAALMHSPDGGYTWTGPHYVLPGIVAWEPDFVELADSRLLVINSSVQQGASVRQIVHRTETGFVCEPLMNVLQGAEFGDDVQSGIVPETIDITPEGLIVGARRGGPYVCSNDQGARWHKISGTSKCHYQPQMICLPDGRILTAWHRGTDAAFGQQDMSIGLHSFRLETNLPAATQLTLDRSLSNDGKQFINRHRARLTVGNIPVTGKQIQLHLKLVWRPDGKYNDTPINQADVVATVITNEKGVAEFALADFESIRDIHHSYDLQASFTPTSRENLAPCRSVSYRIMTLTAMRNTEFSYPIYSAENVMFISGPTAEQYPELVDLTERIDDFNEDLTPQQLANALGDPSRAREIVDFLVANYILTPTANGKYRWHRAIHCGKNVIDHVRVNDLPDYSV